MNNNQAYQNQYPQNTGQLIKYIAKRIPERLIKALPLSIVTGLLCWIAHTVMMLVSDGVYNTETWIARNMLNVSGRLFNSAVLWMMLGAVIPMIISFIMQKKSPAKLISSIVTMPKKIADTNKRSGGRFLPIMLFSCAVTLFIDSLLSGVTSIIMGSIVMSSVVSFLTGRGSIFIQILRMIFQDLQLFLLKKQKLRLDGDNVLMVVGVSGVTLFAIGILKAIFTQVWIIHTILRWIWVVVLILAIIFNSKSKNTPKYFIFFFGVSAITVLLSAAFANVIYAYDGGYYDYGSCQQQSFGNCTFWAIVHGLLPALAALIGAFLASITAGLAGGLNPGYMGNNTGISNEEQARQEQQRTRSTLNETYFRMLENERNSGMTDAFLNTEGEIAGGTADISGVDIDKLIREAKLRKRELDERNERYKRQSSWIEDLKNDAKRGHVTPEERDILRYFNEREQRRHMAMGSLSQLDEHLMGVGEDVSQLTVIGADIGVGILKHFTGPVGVKISAGYKVLKGVFGESVTAYHKDGDWVKGAKGGLVKGGFGAASDVIGDLPVNYQFALQIGTNATGEVWGGYILNGRDGAISGVQNALVDSSLAVGGKVATSIADGVLDGLASTTKKSIAGHYHSAFDDNVIDNVERTVGILKDMRDVNKSRDFAKSVFGATADTTLTLSNEFLIKPTLQME